MTLFAMILCGLGGIFFLAGTVGLLRFPDTFSRLHALTKADNLGLGLIVAGLCLVASSWEAAVKMILLWLAVMLCSTANAYVISRTCYRRRLRSERRADL